MFKLGTFIFCSCKDYIVGFKDMEHLETVDTYDVLRCV